MDGTCSSACLQSRMHGVGAPGAPALGVRRRVGGVVGQPERRRAPRRTAEVGGQERRPGRRARASPRTARSRRRRRGAGQPRPRSRRGRRRRRGRARRRRPRPPARAASPAARPASRTRSSGASATLRPAGREARRRSRRRRRRVGADAACRGPCARRRPRSAGRRSPVPRSRSRRPRAAPGRRAPWRPAAASAGSAPSTASTATGSASRSSRRRQRATAGARSRRSARRSVRRDVPVPRGQRDRRRRRAAAAGRGGSRPSLDRLDAGDRARPPRKSSSASACSGARYGSRSVTVPSPVPEVGGRAAAARSSDGAPAVDLADRVVELAHAAEAGRERDLGEAEVGRLDQHPRGLRALRPGQRERARRRARR